MRDHEGYMRLALELAREAGGRGDTPVGCIIADAAGDVIGRGRNRREESKNAVEHAEILAIAEACGTLGNWRLSGCTMYVTLEPCPMCAWAIIQSRLKAVYFGSYDTSYGALGSKIDLRTLGNSKLQVYGGIMEKECDKILENYFKMLRR